METTCSSCGYFDPEKNICTFVVDNWGLFSFAEKEPKYYHVQPDDNGCEQWVPEGL